MPKDKFKEIRISEKMVHFETKSGRKASIYKFAFIQMVKGPLTQSILEEWLGDEEEHKHE